MTQEQKAIAYDEALERARQFSEYPLLEDSGNIVEYIFPELKESEDERIKKCIIDTLEGYHHLISTGGVTKEQMIAWLEKQAEKPYTFKSIPRLLEMVVVSDRTKRYYQKLIDTLKQEGYVVDAKILTDYLKAMNGENVAMAVQDNNRILNNKDYDTIKSIVYLLHELDNHNFDDWFNSLKEKMGE